jgi:hypothetical protein
MVATLNQIHEITPITRIVSGGAIGADSLAEDWGKQHDIPTLIFKPDWIKYGRSAGIIRNKDIIANADIVLAFWDGVSRGTKNSIDTAKSLGKPLQIIKF